MIETEIIINLVVDLGFFDIVIRWPLKYICFFIRLPFSNGPNFHVFFKASGHFFPQVFSYTYQNSHSK